MFDGLFHKPNVEVSYKPGTFTSGNTIEGMVRVTCEQELEIRRAVVYLKCEEEYEYKIRKRSSRSSYTTTETGSAVLAKNEQPFWEGATLPVGEMAYGFSIQIPKNVRPTYNGDILRVRTVLGANLDIPKAMDRSHEVQPTIYLPYQGPYPQPRHAADREDSDKCMIILKLDQDAARLGAPLRGGVTITPHDNFDAQEVRVEVERTEIVPAHRGNESSEAVTTARLASELAFYSDQNVTLPIDLQLPNSVPGPSVSTPHAVVYWELKVIVALSWRPDICLTRGIQVYNLPDHE